MPQLTVIAKRPFRGPAGRKVQPGESVEMHDGACAAAVRRGDATWEDGSAGPFPPAAVVMPPEAKVVAPPATKADGVTEPDTGEGEGDTPVGDGLDELGRSDLWARLKESGVEHDLEWNSASADEMRELLRAGD